jgi:hypothetical protein
MVNRLTIIPKKTVQLKSFAIEESPVDSDLIALPERPKAIDIRSPSVEGDRKDDPLFGLVAHFEGLRCRSTRSTLPSTVWSLVPD